VSGQKLCQILAPALLAAQWFLSSQNKKLIHLTALLTTVLINRHDLLLHVCRRQHPACLRSILFVLPEARLSARIPPDELGTHCIQKAPQAYFELTSQDFL